jgi:hypothetical protein
MSAVIYSIGLFAREMPFVYLATMPKFINNLVSSDFKVDIMYVNLILLHPLRVFGYTRFSRFNRVSRSIVIVFSTVAVGSIILLVATSLRLMLPSLLVIAIAIMILLIIIATRPIVVHTL